MQQVYWLEQQAAEVRSATDWLSPAEVAHLGSLRIPKRRGDWLLGRWTAKHAIATYLGLSSEPSALVTIEIRPAASGAPEAFLAGRPAPVSISISHRDGRGACAVADQHVALGCDLEIVEPRSEAFVADYFTAEEQTVIAGVSPTQRLRVVALLWSAKESALKALETGLRMDARDIAIELDLHFSRGADAAMPSGWRPCRALHPEITFTGWWQSSGDVVRTMVSSPESRAPVVSCGRGMSLATS